MKRRQICSTFDKYTRTNSLLYWQSRHRNGRFAFSLIYQKAEEDAVMKRNSLSPRAQEKSL